jgi:flagellar biosynthesis component FlhA
LVLIGKNSGGKMQMLNLDDIKLKIYEWLSVNSNSIQLKKTLSKVAFILIIAAYLLPLPVGLSDLLFWLAVSIAIFLTYLEYKFK